MDNSPEYAKTDPLKVAKALFQDNVTSAKGEECECDSP